MKKKEAEEEVGAVRAVFIGASMFTVGCLCPIALVGYILYRLIHG